MHINALYDICENRYVTAITQPHPELNELAAFCQMVDQCSMPDNTIFIADRGYVSINTFAHLLDSNKFFLIRAKTPFASGSFLRYVIDAEKESDQEISLGVTRSKKREYLISNLPADIFSPEDLRELIIQEVYAKLIMYNFASLLHAYATRVKKTSEKDKNIKYEYKVSFDDTIPIAKELLIGGLKKSIIKALLLSHLTAIKRKNSSPRRVRSQTVKPLNNRA